MLWGFSGSVHPPALKLGDRVCVSFFSGALPVQIHERAGDLHKIVMHIFEALTKNAYEES